MDKDSKITGFYNTGKVTVDGILLDPSRSQAVMNHSPTGFAWNYGGSGPSQLALALLLEATDKDTAVKKYQNFKWEVIAKLPAEDFVMPASVIYNWLEKIRKFCIMIS